MTTKTCDTCKGTFTEYVCGQREPRAEGSKIFGQWSDGRVACEDCAADWEREEMKRTGKAVLYLTFNDTRPPAGRMRNFNDIHNDGSAHVSNWPGSMKIKLYPRIAVSRHNIAGRRYDIWFNGPDGHIWHGVQYGDNTQICYCKRTKETYRMQPALMS